MDILTANSSTEIIQVAIQRAKHTRGLMQHDISRELDIRSDNILSMWKKDPEKGIPLNQVIPFSEVTGISREELLHFICVRLDELHGLGTTIDTKAIILIMEEYSKLPPDESVVVDIVREEVRRIGLPTQVFAGKNQEDNRQQLRSAVSSILQREAMSAAEVC